jgi:hypothetical protein
VICKTLARVGALLSTAAATLMLTAVPAAASGDFMSGAGGQDISWPQCGTSVPITSDTFTVVGINGGEPFTMNPCFADQYRAMLNGHAAAPSLYINLQYGATQSGYSNCSEADTRCQSYDYGYLAAQYAYTQANYRTGGASLRAATWWLDVETANNWNDDQGLNAQVVRGALDYLKTTNHRVGVYSTPQQWGEIVGGYNPGPAIGNWVAGAGGLDDYSMCYQPLWAGAPVWLFQYLNLDRDLDEDHSC